MPTKYIDRCSNRTLYFWRVQFTDMARIQRKTCFTEVVFGIVARAIGMNICVRQIRSVLSVDVIFVDNCQLAKVCRGQFFLRNRLHALEKFHMFRRDCRYNCNVWM